MVRRITRRERVAGVDTRTFAPMYTGASWHEVLVHMLASTGTRKGALSNRDAAAFIREWHNAAEPQMEVGRIWYQFAAAAYGWDPPRRDYMRRDEPQAAATYPAALTPDLWTWANGIAAALDKADKFELRGPPRISLDRDTFTDPVFYGEVRAHLQEDGADALFKVPTGYCIDKKTGKRRAPLPPCDSKGRGPYLGPNPKTGKPMYGACDTRDTCEPELIDDPLTASGRSLFNFAVVLAAVWLVLTPAGRKRA